MLKRFRLGKLRRNKRNESNRLQENIELEQKLINDCQEKEREAEDRRRAIEQQEDKAISEIGAPSFKSLVNAFTTKCFGSKVFDIYR